MQCLTIKPNSMIYYAIPEIRRYNKKSKENLTQNKKKTKSKLLQKLENIQNIACINRFTKIYQNQYEKYYNKKLKYSSNLGMKKLQRANDILLQTILTSYKRNGDYTQNMVTFVTLTLPQPQKHTDKQMVSIFVDFIDHLKKVKNTIIKNKIDTGIQAPKLQNYTWKAESQENGNIHFHLLFDVYFNHETLKRVWNNYLKNNGYSRGEKSANIHKINKLNNVSAYVSKYMTKPPLKKKYWDFLKSQNGKNYLETLPDSEKYNRPILAKTWGCSRNLSRMRYPTFKGVEVYDFNQLRLKLKNIPLNGSAADFCKLYVGNIKKEIKTCKGILKKKINDVYKIYKYYLYNTTDKYKKDMHYNQYLDNELNKWKHSQKTEAIPIHVLKKHQNVNQLQLF